MANIQSRVQDAINYFNLAKEGFAAVTRDLNDGREAVNAKTLDQLQAQLKREELETAEARKGLADAIAAYRKRRGA